MIDHNPATTERLAKLLLPMFYPGRNPALWHHLKWQAHKILDHHARQGSHEGLSPLLAALFYPGQRQEALPSFDWQALQIAELLHQPTLETRSTKQLGSPRQEAILQCLLELGQPATYQDWLNAAQPFLRIGSGNKRRESFKRVVAALQRKQLVTCVDDRFAPTT